MHRVIQLFKSTTERAYNQTSTLLIKRLAELFSWYYVMWCTVRERPGDGDDQTSPGWGRPLRPSSAESAPGFSSQCISTGICSIIQPVVQKTTENQVGMIAQIFIFHLLFKNVSLTLFIYLHSSYRVNRAFSDDKPGN